MQSGRLLFRCDEPYLLNGGYGLEVAVPPTQRFYRAGILEIGHLEARRLVLLPVLPPGHLQLVQAPGEGPIGPQAGPQLLDLLIEPADVPAKRYS